MEQGKTTADRRYETSTTGFPDARTNTRGTEQQNERGGDRKKEKINVRYARILRENDLYERQDS